MNFNPKNTLSYFNAVPQVQLFDLREIPAAHFAINCKKLHEEKGGDNQVAVPETDALEFYAINHLTAIVRKTFTPHEELPMWALNVMNAYQTILRKQGNRILNYMVLVTTRESRHVKDKNGYNKNAAEKFGPFVKEFADSINGSGSDGAAAKFMTHPPKCNMGIFCESLSYAFYKGGYSGGFGGKPWGMIADTTLSFINGLTSLEMLLDTAYTLAHNNGPMFNKGMMYSMYDSDLIYKVLDVQRSGQIPELVMSGTLPGKMTKNVLPLVQAVAELFPNEFGPEVDWQKVEDLGSLHKYPSEKKLQKVKAPPVPPKPTFKDGLKIIGQFQVSPGESVDIFQRKTTTTA